MADMPTDFWSGWIVTITIASLCGLVWLIFSIYFSKKETEEFISPVWDETLREGNNPAPMWWFWMIFTALIATVVYLILYPGLGSFSGALKWSQGGRLDQNLVRYSYQHADTRKSIANASIVDLQKDKKLMGSAKRIFVQNCAACHGFDGQGQAMTFPNLIDNDWQWGGTAEDIEQTLRHGRNAVMVSWQAVLGDEGVSQVVDYVKALSSKQAITTTEDNAKGGQLFQQFCVACHGNSGEGNPLLGAPRLSDDIWLYGNSDEQLRHSISIGRNGIMPAFDKKLDDAQIRMLVAWLTIDGN